MAKNWRVILHKFDYHDYYERGDLIIGKCPIHSGRYQSSFNLNINEDSPYFGNWFCNSERCHESLGHDMIGLTFGFMRKDNENVKFPEVVKFCKEMTSDINIDFEERCHDKVINFFAKPQKQEIKLLRREQVRDQLVIPSKYYIEDKKYSPEILDEFDVGLCERPNRQMSGRIVFPVYDEKGEWMVGCVGRGLNPNQDKWINSKGFNKSCYLYGYHKAIRRAKELGALILVEGQGDAIRMHEAGILNTVGIFGASLSDSQEFLLQRSGVMNIVLALDNDPTGTKETNKIRERLKLLFNVFELEISKKDIGEMTIQEVLSLKPQISRFV